MYDAEQASVKQLRLKFEQEMETGAPTARATGSAYMVALGMFVDAFNDGPGADTRRMGSDTTGALCRIEEDVVRAEGERHRVRKALSTLA
jgi:hypothetical protein